MSKTRPVNLNLMKFHFPPMAIVSIMHRISGVLLFLFLPLLLYFFHYSMQSADGFNYARMLLDKNSVKLLFWVVLIATIVHWIAGVRHLFMDLGYGENLVSARRSAIAVLWLAPFLSVLLGIWLWA